MLKNSKEISKKSHEKLDEKPVKIKSMDAIQYVEKIEKSKETKKRKQKESKDKIGNKLVDDILDTKIKYFKALDVWPNGSAIVDPLDTKALNNLPKQIGKSGVRGVEIGRIIRAQETKWQSLRLKNTRYIDLGTFDTYQQALLAL